MTRLMPRPVLSQFVLTLTLCTAAALAAPTVARAADDLNRRVQAANEVLLDLRRIPEQAIPPNLLNRAYAVAVIPNVIKGGFIVGGSYGKGVLMVRRNDGAWSNPAFIKLANVGIGWQAGAGMVGTIPHSKSVNYTLSVLPLFILIGYLAYHAGITQSLFDAAKKWMGWMPGGLAVVVDDAPAPFAPEIRVGDARDQRRVLHRDAALIIISIENPGLHLSLVERAAV